VSFIINRIMHRTIVIGTLGLTIIAAACTAQTAPASESSSASASEPSPSTGYEGYLEKMSCDMVRGWAWNASQPDKALTIELYDGDRLLKTVVADQYRRDLADAHKGNGKHLFLESPAPTEIRDGKSHVIRAVVKGASYTLRPLADTPTSVTCTK
jgi:hypothetical protein